MRTEIALDATMFDTFDLCEAKYDMRHNMNKTSLTKAPPLDRGDLIHKGFEPYYIGLKEGLTFEQSLEMGKQGFHLAATESELEPDEVTFLAKTVIENLTYWRTEDSNLEILEVEKPFAYELFANEHMRIVMIGKIDLLVNTVSHKRLPYDHKSYSREYTMYCDGESVTVLKTSNQFSNYAYAMESSHLVVNRVGLQSSYPPEKKHKRIMLSYDNDLLEQWKWNTVRRVYDYLHCYQTGEWPMRFTSCDKFNRLCEYWDVCRTANRELKQYKLNTNFKTAEPWDVAKSLGLKKS